MKQDSNKENAVLEDRIEYIYIEHAVVEQDDSSVCIIQGKNKTPVPIASIACLILGPGTSITHRAIEAMADSNCLIVWSGEKMRAFYATGMEENRSSKNFLLQAQYSMDDRLHLNVVRKMYKLRFPDKNMNKMSLEQMRGFEGKRIKELYQQYADLYNVNWNGRIYDRNNWDGQDDINKALTIGNKLLYNVIHAAIVTLGYSPTIGFIHTGTMRSFVYDIADLYKSDIVIPTAFKVVNEGYGDLGSHMRMAVREKMEELKLLKHIVKDLKELFCENVENDYDEGYLWDKNNVVFKWSQSFQIMINAKGSLPARRGGSVTTEQDRELLQFPPCAEGWFCSNRRNGLSDRVPSLRGGVVPIGQLYTGRQKSSLPAGGVVPPHP